MQAVHAQGSGSTPAEWKPRQPHVHVLKLYTDVLNSSSYLQVCLVILLCYSGAHFLHRVLADTQQLAAAGR